MDVRALGTIIIVVGVAAVVIGVLVYIDALGWFGRLPGDIRIERDNTRVYIPITSMILVSVVLTVLVNVVRRLF